MKRNVKKLISFILMIMLLSSVGFQTVAAADYSGHWAKDYIDFVTENGYWTDKSDFQPDKPITRAEFSAMFVRTLQAAIVEIVPEFADVDINTPYVYEIYSAHQMGLIQGDGANFYPNNTITRQEAAAILDRASFMIFGKNTESTVNEKRFMDYAQIDEWARPYVFNALESGLMSGPSAKTFNPQGTLTRAETAAICKRISEIRKLDKLDFSIRDAGEDEEKTFSVMQSGITDVMYGISGFAVLARFDKGPGEVYFSRTTKNDGKLDSGCAWDSSPIAKVIDPDGNMVGMDPFEWIQAGTEKKVLKINCQKPGIYTFQVMNGRTGDFFEIGLKNPVSWGIRGEKRLVITDTFPKEGYVYVQRKNQYMYVGGSTDHKIQLLDLDGNVVGTSTAVKRRDTKQDLIVNEVEEEKVYQLKFDPEFQGLMMTDGFPGIISPTPEMAADLKGGWYDDGTVVTQGPIQRRAREKALEIVTTRNLDVVINRPAEVPRDIQNPIAEAQMFGAYGVISGVGAACARQILDPNSPYLGYITDANVYTGKTTIPEVTYEAGHYDNRMRSYGGLATALAIPLELNYAYGNKAIADRLALALLHYVIELGEDSEDRQNCFLTSQNSIVSMFDYDHFFESFLKGEKFFDAETREILYQASVAVGNKMGDYAGQGVTNQGFFHPTNNLRLYIHSGCDPRFEFLHNMYKKQITTIMREDIYGFHTTQLSNGYGFHEGHFIESGFDSSYEYMNREEWTETYLLYKSCKNADPVLVEKMKEVTQHALEFETYFCLPQPGHTAFHLANSWTSRTPNEFGNGNQPGYEKLFHEFPIAALRWSIKDPGDGLWNSGTYPQVINTEEWAWRQIEEFYPKYENYYEPESGRNGNSWPWDTYEAFNAGVVADYSDLILPCYTEDGLKLQTSEVQVLKHKGLYLVNVFWNAHSNGKTKTAVGGAPVMIWSENTGVVERSKKNVDSSDKLIADENTLTHASVYGTLGGEFFHSGKEGCKGYGDTEPNKLEWIEEGKKFVISGRYPDTQNVISWTYELTDTGIDMTVAVSNLADDDDVWLNFPINGQDEKGKSEFDAAAGKLDYIYDGGKGQMSFSWDAANESKFLAEANSDTQNLRRLRIKIPADGLKIHIEAVK